MLAASETCHFSELAARRLRPEPPGFLEPPGNPRGDHELNPDGSPFRPDCLPKPAAVLVPVVRRLGGLSVLFTQRSSRLRAHSGQISFPGGKMDPEDATPLCTALREANEEIGLNVGDVTPLGYGDAYLSSSGFIVTPVIGILPASIALAPNPSEVESIFEVPLAFLMDPENHELHAREWNGRLRQYYAILYEDRYIWGVTAGILRNLYERLHEP